jgi:copper chaperone
MCGCDLHAEPTQSTTINAPVTAVFTVADMTCGHCAGTIKSAFADKLPGAAIEIDVAAKQVRVGADSTSAAAIIAEAGYTPELVA